MCHSVKIIARGGRYKNIVSLGFFCGPSQELERIGLRSFSLPFDWLITEDFQVVLSLIETHFEGFLNEENLEQEIGVNPKYYYDTRQKIHFYHDFSASVELRNQLPMVKQKYGRRIERFYKIISEPCLFIRYCFSKEEYCWVCEHIEQIRTSLKRYDKYNEIIFVCNQEDVNSIDKGEILAFSLPRDENDFVSRRFIKGSKALRHFIETNVYIGVCQRIENYFRYYKQHIYRKIRKKS